MQHNATSQRVTVHEHGVWAKCGEAQLLALEANKVIAQQIAAGIRGLWRRIMRQLDVRQPRHVPPV